MTERWTTLHEGWFATDRALVLAGAPRQGWSTAPGGGVVIALYSSRRARGFFDRGVFNDELVVHVPAELVAPGARLRLNDHPVRYQHGDRKLAYVSRTIDGWLEIDTWTQTQMEGRAAWVADAPEIDVLGDGRVERESRFCLSRHTP